MLNGAGDEQILTPSSSIDQQPMDFTELQQIFDNAVRNRLSIELRKDKPPQKDLILTPLSPIPELQPIVTQHPLETRLTLPLIESSDERRCSLIAHVKEHRILSAITCVTFSAFLGFVGVFVFIKPPF